MPYLCMCCGKKQLFPLFLGTIKLGLLAFVNDP